jgi:hypothetical protein
MIKVEDYYNMIITFKKNMKTELPVISISIFLFLTLWIFFGKYNMILPPFLTFYFNLMGKKSPTSIGGAMNFLIFF